MFFFHSTVKPGADHMGPWIYIFVVLVVTKIRNELIKASLGLNYEWLPEICNIASNI